MITEFKSILLLFPKRQKGLLVIANVLANDEQIDEEERAKRFSQLRLAYYNLQRRNNNV
nr:hypothetical protein 15 [Bacillales bacterium]